MIKKQNIFYVLVAVLCVEFLAGMPSVQAKDISALLSTQPSTATTGPADIISQWMSHIRTRNGAQVFAVLSPAQHDKYHKNAQRFMKSLRVLHHAIYDHVSYRILTPVLQDSGDKTEAVIKIQLVNHKGQESFGVIRMIREDHKSWEIDGFTIIPDDDGRNA